MPTRFFALQNAKGHERNEKISIYRTLRKRALTRLVTILFCLRMRSFGCKIIELSWVSHWSKSTAFDGRYHQNKWLLLGNRNTCTTINALLWIDHQQLSCVIKHSTGQTSTQSVYGEYIARNNIGHYEWPGLGSDHLHHRQIPKVLLAFFFRFFLFAQVQEMILLGGLLFYRGSGHSHHPTTGFAPLWLGPSGVWLLHWPSGWARTSPRASLIFDLMRVRNPFCILLADSFVSEACWHEPVSSSSEVSVRHREHLNVIGRPYGTKSGLHSFGVLDYRETRWIFVGQNSYSRDNG